MKTATVITTVSRHTGQVLKKEIMENPGEVDSSKFYRPLVEVIYKGMKEKGLIK